MANKIITTIDDRLEISRRIKDKELPTSVYALAGAIDVLRESVAAAPQRVEVVRGRVIDLRERVVNLPDTLEDSAEEFVTDLRKDATDRYQGLAQRGEKKVTQMYAERAINAKVDQVAKKVTPAAARASVTAKTTAKKVAQSPTGKKTAAATKRATAATKRAVASVTEIPADAPVAETTA